MRTLRLALAAPVLLLASPVAYAGEQLDPLEFFEGRTETQATVKVILRKPYRTQSVGHGRIGGDGALTLVQKVKDEGKPTHERRWTVRRSGAEKFTASMSEAVGPVTIDRVGPQYRFRFKMKGNLQVEQMLTPEAGGRSAKSAIKVRRMGVVVATTNGTIRKV